MDNAVTDIKTEQAQRSNAPTSSSEMTVLLLLSTLCAAANTLLYKATLNAFSSPTTNYGFFAGQFSQLLYLGQAAAVSAFLGFKDISSLKEILTTPHSIYVYMGLLDAGSSTLAAISGAKCPGQLQTIMNQLIIPMTLVGAALVLRTSFKAFQIGGSSLITLGAIVASLSYFFNLPDDYSDVSSTAASTAAVVTYFISIAPSALSNIYKEEKMKERDMHEFHTSTVVSFWQLWFGFLFLPLLFIPSLGGLQYDEMAAQVTDGFVCFMGENPNDPLDTGCRSAFWLMMAYIFVNFLYNVLLLAITKRGSAVLLVVSQALSLPVTNIAFSLRIFMGNDAEPLSVLDLVGLVLVCIGFLTYSGFGFASNFVVPSGAPGQMTFLHFDDVDQVVISAKMAEEPQQMNQFLVGSLLHQAVVRCEKLKAQAIKQANRAGGGGCMGFNIEEEEVEEDGGGDKGNNRSGYGALPLEEESALMPTPAHYGGVDERGVGGDKDLEMATTVRTTTATAPTAADGSQRGAPSVLASEAAAAACRRAVLQAACEATPIAASKKALEITREMVRLLEQQVALLELSSDVDVDVDVNVDIDDRPGAYQRDAAGSLTDSSPHKGSGGPGRGGAEPMGLGADQQPHQRHHPRLSASDILQQYSQLSPHVSKDENRRLMERAAALSASPSQTTGGGRRTSPTK